MLQNQHIAVRVPKALFEDRPVAADLARLRMRFGDVREALTEPFTGATYLGDDATYWYYDFPVAQIPAQSEPNMQYDSPSELVDIDVPYSSIIDPPHPGEILLFDGPIHSPAVTNFGTDHFGNFDLVDPTFSIAVGDPGEAGFITAEMSLDNTARNPNNLVFDNGTQSDRVFGRVSAAAVRVSTSYQIQPRQVGVEVCRSAKRLAPGTARVGYYVLYAAQNSAGNIGFNVVWRESGNTLSGSNTTDSISVFATFSEARVRA